MATVGFVGLGVMGGNMVDRLAKRDFACMFDVLARMSGMQASGAEA